MKVSLVIAESSVVSDQKSVKRFLDRVPPFVLELRFVSVAKCVAK